MGDLLQVPQILLLSCHKHTFYKLLNNLLNDRLALLSIETQNRANTQQRTWSVADTFCTQAYKRSKFVTSVYFPEGAPGRPVTLERNSGTGDYSPLIQMSPLVYQQTPSEKRDKLD